MQARRARIAKVRFSSRTSWGFNESCTGVMAYFLWFWYGFSEMGFHRAIGLRRQWHAAANPTNAIVKSGPVEKASGKAVATPNSARASKASVDSPVSKKAPKAALSPGIMPPGPCITPNTSYPKKVGVGASLPPAEAYTCEKASAVAPLVSAHQGWLSRIPNPSSTEVTTVVIS